MVASSRLPAIPIFIPETDASHAAYIFSHGDAFETRTKHRLLGDLIGTLPKHTSQNQYLSLPLALSFEEASFGLSRGIFRIVSDAPTTYAPAAVAAAAFTARRKADLSRQADEAVLHQLAERNRRASKCLSRKRPRDGDAPQDPEAAPEPRRKLAKLSFLSRVTRQLRAAAHALVPAFVAPVEADPPVVPPLHPVRTPAEEQDPVSEGDAEEAAREAALRSRLRHQATAVALVLTETEARSDERGPAVLYGHSTVFSPPRGVSASRLRSRGAVFADLHDKGYYLSCGAKFGADFLAYAGDPQLFHAALAVVVVEAAECVSPLDVVALGRLGDSTKKRTVLAFLDGGAVNYVGVQWEETLP